MLEAFVGMLVVYGMVIVLAQLSDLLGQTKLPH
jgi:hypothetical protein